MESNKKEKLKKDIKSELISNDLTELIKILLAFILLTGIFGYIGYTYCMDNNQDIKHGIVFGSLFPLGFVLIKTSGFGNIFFYIIYTIAYICLVEYIPTFVGIIILFVIITLFILCFIYIEKKDRTEETSKIYNFNNRIKIHPIKSQITKEISGKYIPIIDDELEDYMEKDIFNEDEKLECECERCFKKISLEEYESNDFMCEDCYQEVHTDKHGNFHDDEYFDF